MLIKTKVKEGVKAIKINGKGKWLTRKEWDKGQAEGIKMSKEQESALYQGLLEAMIKDGVMPEGTKV